MKELDDDDLLLYHYDEAPDGEEIRRRLESSPELQARYEALCRDLELAERAMVPPERPASYGAELWARLEPRLAAADAASGEPASVGGRLLAWLRPARPQPDGLAGERRPGRRAGLAAAAILLLAAGFSAGRLWQVSPKGRPGPAPATEATLSAPARERILLQTVAEHFERSERLFTEVANAPGDGPVDLGAERRWARDLLEANRLYRQSARQGAGQGEASRLGPLLDELEPFLLDLSHGPDEMPASELDDLRRRFEERALLFKLRVAGSRLSGPQTL